MQKIVPVREQQERAAVHWLLLSVLLSPLLPDFLSPVLPLLYLFYYLRAGRPVIRTEMRSLLIFVLLLFFAWRIIGIFYSGFWLNGVSITFLWLSSFTVALLFPVLVTRRELLDKALLYIGISGGIAGFIGTVQILIFKMKTVFTPEQRKFFNPFWEWINRLVAKCLTLPFMPQFITAEIPRSVPIDINDRANSTFTNPVFFAVFLVLAFPVAVYGLLYCKERIKKISYGISCLCMLGGLAFSYSRGPYLAFAVSLFVLLFYGKKMLLLALGAAPVGLLVMWRAGVIDRLLTIFNSADVSISIRTNIWKACLALLREHWLFGIGTGVEPLRKILAEQYGIEQPHAHNIVLELLVENGVFGLCFFAAVIGAFIWNVIRLCKLSREGRLLGVTLLSCMAGFLFCGATEYILYGPKLVFSFFVLLGLSLAAQPVLQHTQVKAKEGELGWQAAPNATTN